MNLLQLSANRLNICINSLQKDTTLPDCIKLTLKNILEYLNQHTMNIQIIQSELCNKANCSQLNFGLSQKLSAVQFLQYFNRVQKLMEIMQRNQNKQRQTIQKTLDQQNQKIDKMYQSMQNLSKQWQRKRKLQQLQLETIKQQTKQTNKKLDRFRAYHQELSKNLQINNKDNFNEKFTQVITQIRQIQKNCLEIKMNVDDIIQNFQLKMEDNNSHYNNTKENFLQQQKFVTFDQLRVVLAQLQQNLSESLNKYVSTLIIDKTKNKENYHGYQNTSEFISIQNILFRQKNSSNIISSSIHLTPTFNPHSQNAKNNQNSRFITSNNTSLNLQWESFHYFQQKNLVKNKFIVHFYQTTHSANSTTLQSPTNSSQIKRTKIYSEYYDIQKSLIQIRQKGFYQIICGVIPNIPTQLKVLLNNQILASHAFIQIPKKGICRAIMLYIRVENCRTQIQVQCSPINVQQHDSSKSCIKNNKKKNCQNNLQIQNSYWRNQRICGFFTINKLS